MRLLRVALAAVLVLPAAAEGPPAEKPQAGDQAKAEEKPNADSKPKIEISGYAQLDFRQADPGSLETTADHEVNARRVRLTTLGHVNDRISCNVTLQGDGLNANNVSIIDGYAILKLASFVSAQLGQFKYDFDLSGREPDPLMTLADRSLPTNDIAGGLNGASTPSSPSGIHRDRGLSLAGERGRLGYSVGMFQGNARASDNNSAFAFVGRLQYRPRKKMLVSAGYLDSDTANQGAATKSHYRGWTFGAAYESERVFVRGEYYGSHRQLGIATDKPEGFYVEGAFGVTRDLEALARYEELRDPAMSTLGKAKLVNLGGRYWLLRKGRGGSSLVANVMLRDAPDGPVSGLTLLNDGRGATLADGKDFGAVFVLRLQVQF